MQNRLFVGSFMALVVSGALVLACGDDDDAATNNTPDSGTPDSGTPEPDSGLPTDDAGPDATVPAHAPIAPLATTRLANAIDPYGLVFASDGFIYASGATMDGADRKLAVWRFKDGALDTDFGTEGVITTDLPGNESSYDIVEVSAGNFVVHATAGGKVYLVKLTNTGGTWAFGTPKFVKFGYDVDENWPSGTPNMPADPPSYASWGVGLDKSDAASPKLVVFAHGAPAKAASAANQRTDNDRWITRVSADTLDFDTTFNGGAPFTADADGKGISDGARRGLVLPDGSIVSSGYTNFGQGLGNHVVLIRLLPTGAVDPAFGFGTTEPTPGQNKFNPFVGVGGMAEAYGVVRQSSGRYVTTGYGTSNFEVPTKAPDLVSFGVLADGLDTSYGNQGSFAWQSENDKGAGLGLPAPFEDRGRDLVVLPDDRLVHAGAYDGYAALFVLDKDGKPDPSSGLNGMIDYEFPSNFFKIAASADGTVLAATARSVNQTGDSASPPGSILTVLKVGQ